MYNCSIPIDAYLKCLNDNNIKTVEDKENKCKDVLTEYNNCVLGKVKYEENNLLDNLNSEKKHDLNN